MKQSANKRWQEGKKIHIKLSEKASDTYDKDYAKANYSTGLYMQYELETIDRAIAALKNKRSLALDLGSGTGRDMLHYTNKFKKVIGYDFSPKMIKISIENAKRKNIKNVEFSQRDLDQNGLFDVPKNSVDFINAGFGMGSFFENIDRLLTDMKRVLKPGGMFTMSFYNSQPLIDNLPRNLWSPSLSVKIEAKTKKLIVNVNNNEFAISSKAYSRKELESKFSEYFKIVEISSFPTLSSILPNQVFKNAKIRELTKFVDYSIRLNEDFANGPYLLMVCKKN